VDEIHVVSAEGGPQEAGDHREVEQVFRPPERGQVVEAIPRLLRQVTGAETADRNAAVELDVAPRAPLRRILEVVVLEGVGGEDADLVAPRGQMLGEELEVSGGAAVERPVLLDEVQDPHRGAASSAIVRTLKLRSVGSPVRSAL